MPQPAFSNALPERTLLQLGVLRFGSDEDGNVGVFPLGEEVLIRGRAWSVCLRWLKLAVCSATKDLFLAQKIKVGVTAGTRVDYGGKIP